MPNLIEEKAEFLEARKAVLKRNLEELYAEIADCAQACGRRAEDIQLVAVSKNHPASDIRLLHDLGVNCFGENRVQELCDKMENLSDLPAIKWHLIGSLQRNKVKFVVGKVELIHSVHNLKLIRQIERISEEQGVEQDILLQVNIANEASKQGFAVEDLAEAVELSLSSAHLRLRGLMCMAPFFKDSRQALPVFQTCQQEFAKLQSLLGNEQINCLSMGMSADFKEAIAAGATDIRVGSRIFGERIYR